jgi:hypothetical protein
VRDGRASDADSAGARTARKAGVAFIIAAVLAGVSCGHDSSPLRHAPETDAFAIVERLDRAAADDLWPGFDARRVPLAIFDGRRTLLFRHPTPPDGFAPFEGHPGVVAHPGRHPAVVANSSIDLGGTVTATLLAEDAARPPAESAATLVHEAFHVFQRERHPGWIADEAALFTYPVEDAEALALRRLESAALRQALLTDPPRATACRARAALALRAERFARLPRAAAAYERGTELNEGLAAYVEQRAAGRPAAGVLPAEEFPPEAVRLRAYASGAALARILDRLDPEWRSRLDRDDATSLDRLLLATLRRRLDPGPSCAPTADERAGAREEAGRDLALLRHRRAEMRRAFAERAGWRLVVVASAHPLQPQGFDPLNLETIGSGEILHTRFLRLGNEAGSVEVTGRAAVTVAAGGHPLFDGVRALIIAGMEDEPAIGGGDGIVRIDAKGVRAELRGAGVEIVERTVTVTLDKPRKARR